MTIPNNSTYYTGRLSYYTKPCNIQIPTMPIEWLAKPDDKIYKSCPIYYNIIIIIGYAGGRRIILLWCAFEQSAADVDREIILPGTVHNIPKNRIHFSPCRHITIVVRITSSSEICPSVRLGRSSVIVRS